MAVYPLDLRGMVDHIEFAVNKQKTQQADGFHHITSIDYCPTIIL